jgi:uncharacterized protein YggE
MRAWQRRSVTTVALVGAITLAAVGLSTVGSPQAGAQARRQSSDSTGTKDPRTINVVGTGQVRGTPDVLDLTIGVSTRSKSAGEALGRNSDLTNKVVGVLKDAGVDAKDIQTSNLSISPVYDDQGENVIAYGVTNTVDVTIRDLDKAGEIVDAAAKVAGDEIVVNGLSFSFDDNSELVAQARTEAVKRAKAQAEQLAKAAGVELGDVLTITEAGVPDGPVIAAAPREAGSADASTPIEPGSQSLSVQVSITYEIA